MEGKQRAAENSAEDRDTKNETENPETKEVKSRVKKPEALGVLAVEPKHERLGHIMLEAESGDDKSEKQILPAGEQLKGKRIDTLGRAELLALSEKIVIDGSTLRQIYETHLIGERGLRRLITEYMHGGDLHQALQMEILEREMDFERDPVMRDMAPSVTASEAAGNDILDKLLEKASVSVAGSKEESAFIKARDRYEAEHGQLQRNPQIRYMDIAMFLVIGVLAILVILMYLSRR